MSNPTELGIGENVKFGTLALAGTTRVFLQNLDKEYKGSIRIRPVGAEVTNLTKKLLGESYYLEWEGMLSPYEIKELTFQYVGAIMEVTNIGHTSVKVWTDL